MRIRRSGLLSLLVFAGCAAPASAQAPSGVPPSPPAASVYAGDGVTLNDEGLPQYGTFSLCAIDPATGQSGAAVTTRVPFVGRAVPWVRAGVGAVCTQAATVVEYGQRGLDLMARGVEPSAAIAQLLVPMARAPTSAS